MFGWSRLPPLARSLHYGASAMLLHRGRCANLTTALILSTLLSLCSADYVQKNTTDTPGYALLAGVSSVPSPVTVSPNQDWDGVDGAWNTFTLRVGSREVIARVLVSTASQQTWVVNTEACEAQYTDPANNSVVTKLDSDCEDSRGRVFNTTESSSWKTQGFYELWVGQGLGILGNGFYGYDTVRLGIAPMGRLQTPIWFLLTTTTHTRLQLHLQRPHTLLPTTTCPSP